MPQWTLYVFTNKTYHFHFDKGPDAVLTSELKQMVATKLGLGIEDVRLHFAGKQLRDDVDLPLGEYMIHNESTVHFIQWVTGGSAQPFKADSRPLPTHLPKAEDPCTLCYETPALKLPCSHPYCSNCVADYAWNEANQSAKLRSEVLCCLCREEWSFKVLMEYGGMTKEEVHLLANCLSQNHFRDPEKFIQCPGCNCHCERKDNSNPRFRCQICKKEYCWHCKKTWRSAGTATKCGNCNDTEVLKDIKQAPMKELYGVTCPSIRLCPECGAMIEHKDRCPSMDCRLCKITFCFICLRTPQNGSSSCPGGGKCGPAAPIQSVVPRK